MAQVDHTDEDRNVHRVVLLWEGAANGGTEDTFQAYRLQRIPYSMMVQVEDADAWAGSPAPTITIEGSLDNTSYYALQDRSQTDISITADSLVPLGEVPLWIKPVLADGDSGTDIDVRLILWFDKL